MTARTPQQILFEARELAGRHGLYVIEVQDNHGERYVTAYVLFRRNPAGGRGQRIGKRRDPADVLRLIKTTAGIAPQETSAE